LICNYQAELNSALCGSKAAAASLETPFVHRSNIQDFAE